MKRTLLNLLIDSLAAILLVGMIATGYILRFPLPPGTNKSLSLWGLTRHEWGEAHYGISIGLLVILLLHVFLHWTWIVTVVARQFRPASHSQGHPLRSGLITIAVLAAVLGLFAWATKVSVKELDDSMQPHQELNRRSSADSSTFETAVPTHDGARQWKDVSLVLEESCLPCHNSRNLQGGFRIDRREDYFRKNGEALVVPGSADESLLISIVSGQKPGMRMAARHKLPEPQVAVLRAWIDAGADWPEERDLK